MSERFLVLQHVAVEHPGIFRDFMRADGIAWDTVELDTGGTIPSLDAYSALIVMGGPMDVWEEDRLPWLRTEKAVIRRWVEELRRPYLGVCLGHQLLAAALGEDVRSGARAEVGVMSVELTPAGRVHPFFAGIEDRFPCLQWHGAEVVTAPAGSAVLAASPDCAIQALAYGEHALSIQFHVEILESTVDEWGAIEAYRTALETTLGADGLSRFREAAAAHMGRFNVLAKRLYDNWRQSAFAASLTPETQSGA